MNQPRSAPPDLPGFTLVRGIGAGGYADVFLYNQQRPFRPVAVKVLRAEHLSDESLRQFATEADVMAQVSHHPYIVTIHTSGVAPDGRPYIVMEHYPNPHFGIRARGGRLAVSEVLQVGVQVASAVETAHRAGILHRDIKPANILTSEYGRPGLTDFGISAVRSDETVSGALGVTLAFASPEVILDGVGREHDASDVYSLCATLYSLLAGHAPTWQPGGDNSDVALLQRVTQGVISPLTRTDVPPTLVHLLRNGLSPEPGSRPQSARGLAGGLQAIEQELSLSPTPLEIRDDLADAAVPAPSPDADLDGTRRSPRVAIPDRPPSPASAAPAPAAVAEPMARSGSTPGVAPVEPTGRQGTGTPAAVVEVPETIRRPATARPEGPAPTAPVPTAAAARGRRGRVIAGVVAAGAVLAVVGIAVRGLDGEPPTTTARRAADPAATTPGPEVVQAVELPAPTGVEATLDRTGRLAVTFNPVPAGSTLSYRLTRTDGGAWPGAEPYMVRAGSPAMIEGLPTDRQVCLTVRAVDPASGAASERSEQACSGIPR